jgi:hypothetical protein
MTQITQNMTPKNYENISLLISQHKITRLHEMKVSKMFNRSDMGTIE